MVINKNPLLDHVQRVRDFGTLRLPWDVFFKSFSQSSEISVEKKAERMLEPESASGSEERASSRPKGLIHA